MTLKENNNLIIYQAENGAIELRGDFDKETIWASQKQIAEVFGVSPQNITMHLKNIFDDNELNKSSTCKESLQVQIEGNREVKRKILEYNLDVIIAVGYRINSVIGTKFRQWATQTLKQHITEGYTLNKKVLENNRNKFNEALETIQYFSKNIEASSSDVLELIKSFTHTWFTLESYDEDKFPAEGFTKKILKIQAEDLYADVEKFKGELIKRSEATDLFAQEKKSGNLEGILGNVMQSAFGEDVYKTVEEKAVHLLYFVIKNHPFNDGNKRTGAFSFIWFLEKSEINFKNKITPEALATMTLFVAESKPEDKNRVIGLLLLLLK